MLIDGQFPVAAPPHALMRHLFDARLMASCLPGCESLEAIDAERYRAVVVMAMAGIKARFELLVQITRHDDNNIWATTRGEEGGQASKLQADSQVTLVATADGHTLVTYHSEVSITGRLGRFALGMMKKKAQNMGEEFAANLRGRLEALEVHPGASVDAMAAASASAGQAPAPGATAASGSADAPTPRWWRALGSSLFDTGAPAPKPEDQP
ncbi:MAG: hypothetical protein JNM01_20105 [Delftia acidovorans]|nr:hypothetical protein [Delftia acidovorans]